MSKAVIIAALLISIAIIIFGYFNYSYKLKVLESEREQENARKTGLVSCINDAQIQARAFWNKSCQGEGLENDCKLPAHLADTVNKYLEQLEDNCYKLYK